MRNLSGAAERGVQSRRLWVYLVGGEPDTEDLQLMGDEGLEAQDDQVHDDGVAGVAQAGQAVCHETTTGGVDDDGRRACKEVSSEHWRRRYDIKRTSTEATET